MSLISGYATAGVLDRRPAGQIRLANQFRHGSQIRPQLSAAGSTNRPQAKVINTILIIKLKLWLAAGYEANAAAEIGSRPLVWPFDHLWNR